MSHDHPALHGVRVEPDGTLNLAGKQMDHILDDEAKAIGPFVKVLDLTDNNIKSFKPLRFLTAVTDLIIDKNNIESLDDFPVMPTVTTLWMNNNRISSLPELLEQLQQKFPDLRYLSMMRNPACPNVYFDDGEENAYQRYRYYVIYSLKKLNFLDATAVTADERDQAERIGKFMKPARPDSSQYEFKSAGPKDVDPILTQAQMLEEPLPKPAAFLARGKIRYDGSHSEGNRFIVNDDL